MAHKGIYTKSPQWWKHLRPFWKRRFNKQERKAWVKNWQFENAEEIFKLGLTKSASTMHKMKYELGESVIPDGCYCQQCPYFDCATNKEEQSNGFCWYIGRGDWDDPSAAALLWDGCKECGIKDKIDGMW